MIKKIRGTAQSIVEKCNEERLTFVDMQKLPNHMYKGSVKPLDPKDKTVLKTFVSSEDDTVCDYVNSIGASIEKCFEDIDKCHYFIRYSEESNAKYEADKAAQEVALQAEIAKAQEEARVAAVKAQIESLNAQLPKEETPKKKKGE